MQDLFTYLIIDDNHKAISESYQRYSHTTNDPREGARNDTYKK